MTRRLKAENRALAKNHIYVFDAVLRIARAQDSSPFSYASFDKIFPFYMKKEKRGRRVVAVAARKFFRKDDDGTIRSYWEDLEVLPSKPIERARVQKELQADWERIKTALHTLINFVLDGKVKGRIEQTYTGTLTLNHDQGVRLRGQKLTALSSSFLRLKQGKGNEWPALVSIDQASLSSVLPTLATSATDSDLSSSAAPEAGMLEKMSELQFQTKWMSDLKRGSERFAVIAAPVLERNPNFRIATAKLERLLARYVGLHLKAGSNTPYYDASYRIPVPRKRFVDAITNDPNLKNYIGGPGGPKKGQKELLLDLARRVSEDAEFSACGQALLE